jgi:hypothetical protein
MKLTPLGPLFSGFSLLALLASGCAGKTVDVGDVGKAAQRATGDADPTTTPATTLQPTATTIVLGDQTYNPPTCAVSESEMSDGWVGPTFSAVSGSTCSWPLDKPELMIEVLLRGFLESAGFTPGTYDLADPKLANLVIVLSTHSQNELPVGQSQPYARYSSSATADDAAAGAAVKPAAGVSGKVTIGQFQANPNDYSVPPNYDVTLENVVLPIHHDAGRDDSGFPGTAKIVFAHLVGS